MPKFAANISLLFTEHDVLARFQQAAKAGFQAVEMLFPYAWDVGEIKSRLDAHGLELVLFNLFPGDWDSGERGLAALKDREGDFDRALDQALAYAQALGTPRLHAMAGLLNHGANRETYLANLERAASRAKTANVDILIEPINTQDFPGYFLNRTRDAADIIDAIASPNLGLQFDLYHRHMMEGDVLGALKQFAHLARHYQVAGPPDRGEPHPSDMDCKPLFDWIDASGYEGWIGCEYRPRTTTQEGLSWFGQCGISPIG